LKLEYETERISKRKGGWIFMLKTELADLKSENSNRLNLNEVSYFRILKKCSWQTVPFSSFRHNIDGIGQNGFTLIELISVMIIMSVFVSIGVQRFDILGDTAADQALDVGKRELNVREALTWLDFKLAGGWTEDDEIFNNVDKNLGQGYHWNAEPTPDGGTLDFRSHSVALHRDHSTGTSTGNWH
jgi:prepilin-type N-terminal cleavage/methylation domain-containing protein